MIILNEEPLLLLAVNAENVDFVKNILSKKSVDVNIQDDIFFFYLKI